MPFSPVPRRRSSQWYLALDISERHPEHHTPGRTHAPIGSDRAERRLADWRRHYLFQSNAEAYAERLAADGLCDATLLALLAEDSCELDRRLRALPDDVRDLAAMLESEGPDEAGIAKIVSAGSADPTYVAVLRLIAPILAHAVARLETGVTLLCQRSPGVPFDPARAVALLTNGWPAHLAPMFLRTLALEVKIARVGKALRGETPQARFIDFAARICTPEGRRAFFLEYPVLARLVARKLDHWVTFGLEHLTRLTRDWPDILTTFSPGTDPGHLLAVEGNLGDSHRQGRSVLILRFASGLKLVYKPRSLAVDVHFQQALLWLNARFRETSDGFPAFKVINILDRADYGWCEFVEAATCHAASQVERFFTRQGAYVALLHALHAVDFHSENVIANGEYPIAIDLEALFHPVVDLWSATFYRDPATKMWPTTVINLGLLPERAGSSEEHAGYDISGMGNRAGQRSAELLPVIKQCGTDEMHLSYERIEIGVNESAPTLDGEVVDATKYLPQIVEGFEVAYRCLMSHRREFMAGPLAAFRHDPVRHIAMATQLYDHILTTSLHPDYLRDALERERILNRLWRVPRSDDRFARLFQAERADLREGDVPYFWTHADSCDLHDSRGGVIPNFFSASGYVSARRRLRRFDETDLARQLWMIRSSFATVPLGLGEQRWRGHPATPTDAPVSRDELLAMACEVGQRVLQLAVTEGDYAGWLGVALIKDREWQLMPLGFDVYNGASGIALFLAQLGAITREARFTEMARAAVNSILRHMQSAADVDGPSSVGAFTGLSAPLFLCAHLAKLWQQPALLDRAEEFISVLRPHVENDTGFDVLDGSAGAILSLLALHRVRPSRVILEAACGCGDHLLKSAVTSEGCPGTYWLAPASSRAPRSGFAHGTSGIALALLELSAWSGDIAYRRAGLSALECERHTLSQQNGSRRDVQRLGGHTVEAAATAPHLTGTWCHGAPGIGLARVMMRQHLDDPELSKEITAAVDTTLEFGFGLNHCLCHGDLGNLDFLQMALAGDERAATVSRLTSMVVRSIRRDGWLPGIPHGIESPGLMSGISGIGYGLLRLARPEHVPSIIALEPPRTATA